MANIVSQVTPVPGIVERTVLATYAVDPQAVDTTPAPIPAGRRTRELAYRLEVWNRTGTEHLADFRSVISWERHWRLKSDEGLVATIAANDPALAVLSEGAVLRFAIEGTPLFSTWRLAGVTESRDQKSAHLVELECDALWMDIRHGRVRQVLADGRVAFAFSMRGKTVTHWLTTYILPGYDGDGCTFELGVVEIDDEVTLSFDSTSPAAALRNLEVEAKGEVQYRQKPDGTGFFVDFLERVGVAGGTGELVYGKNITAIQRQADTTEVVTRLYPKGSGILTVADAEWVVSQVAPNQFTLSTGPDWNTSASPLFEDGAYVGRYFFVAGQTPRLITASATVHTGGGASYSLFTCDAGGANPFPYLSRGWFALDVDGTRMPYIESAAARAAFGTRPGDFVREDVPDAVNLAPNAFLSAWTAGLPDSTTVVGTPTLIERRTDGKYARQGGAAAYIECDGADEGLSFPITITERTDRPFTGLRVPLTVILGAVRVELRRVSDGLVYPREKIPYTVGLDIYQELVGPLDEDPLPAGAYELRVLSHGGAAKFYLDAVMVTPQINEEVPGVVETNGAHVLYFAAADELVQIRQPRRDYRINLVDLYRSDPERFPFDELRGGDDVPVRDPDFAPETLRIVELRERDGAATDVVVAASAELRVADEVSMYMPQRRRTTPGAGASTQAASSRAAVLRFTADPNPVDGKVYIAVLANAATATLELFVKASGVYPGSPTAVINGRAGTFPGIEVPPGVVLTFTIQALDAAGVVGDAWESTYVDTLGTATDAGNNAKAPTLFPRVVPNDNGNQADVFVAVDSPIGEGMRVRVRDSDVAGAPVWALCQGDGNAAALYVADASEVGPTSWFVSTGGQFAQRLAAIPLTRDMIRRVYVEAVGQDTNLSTGWTPVPLEAMRQPWLESLGVEWNDTTGNIEVEVSGGAHCASVLVEASPDRNFVTGVRRAVSALDDGETVLKLLDVPGTERGRSWYVRAYPYNGELVDTNGDSVLDSPSGLAGKAQRMPVYVVPVPPPVLQTVASLTDPDGDWRYDTAYTADARTLSVRIVATYTDAIGTPRTETTVAAGAAGSYTDLNVHELGEDATLAVEFTPYTGAGATGVPGQPVRKTVRRAGALVPLSVSAVLVDVGQCYVDTQKVSVTWSGSTDDEATHHVVIEASFRNELGGSWGGWGDVTPLPNPDVADTHVYDMGTVHGGMWWQEVRYRVTVVHTASDAPVAEGESNAVDVSYKDCPTGGGFLEVV